MRRRLRSSTEEDHAPEEASNLADTDVDTDTEPSRAVDQGSKASKFHSFKTRLVSTIAMIASFLTIVYLGHVPLVMLVFTLQFLMVKELFKLARDRAKDKKVPGFRLQQWYFFLVATFYLYLRFIKVNLLVEITSDRTLARLFSSLLRRHTLISFLGYIGGFVAFVRSLERGMYLYQFKQYAWTHMILMIIFLPSSFFVSNIFQGLVWFLLPTCLIIVNDIMAYLAGICFGRTPLIEVSPKKTWEGFIGGVAGTVLAAFYLAQIFSKFQWMTCPRTDLSLGRLQCVPDDIYNKHTYTWEEIAKEVPEVVVDLIRLARGTIPVALQERLDTVTFTMEPMQVHAMVLAVFASLIAPFGGFFASGFKRAFNMKDFGDTIPGHGGVTDRFDCQILMAVFSYIYYWNYVAKPVLSVGDVLNTVLKLNDGQQVELFEKLGNMLVGEGLIPRSIQLSLKDMQ